MIYEFRNPIPVNTELGGGTILYVQSGGTFSNDIFSIVLEHDGRIRHFRSDQFTVLENPTFDIKNENKQR
jgi:hypothetical protein